MKGSRNQNNHQSKQGHVNTPKPDIRDDMDSRMDKEDNENPFNPKKPVNANKAEKKPKQ